MSTLADIPAWLPRLGGKFLVFDGPDGCGKTTQLHRFEALASDAGLEVCHVREPGGTAIGEQVRTVLLDPANTEMDLRCETLLYMASRAQLVSECIAPAIQAGKLVLADRFVSSTLAYQGAAGGMDAQEILDVARIAVRGSWPDLVVVFNVDAATAAARLMGGSSSSRHKKYTNEPSLFADRIEAQGDRVQNAVRESFLEQAREHPKHYVVVDAKGDEEVVFAELMRVLSSRFGKA